MNDYSKKARKLFREGYNCAQSVFCTFAEDFGLDFETALKLASSFGGGMGRMREVCGAVSGMFMAAVLNTVIPLLLIKIQKLSITKEYRSLQIHLKTEIKLSSAANFWEILLTITVFLLTGLKNIIQPDHASRL